MARRDLAPLAARLAAGAVFLHRREYALAAPPRKGDRSLTHEILGRTWQGITPDATASMWNGGIIGSSRRHEGIFDRTLAVFDEMRPVRGTSRWSSWRTVLCSPRTAPSRRRRRGSITTGRNRQWFDRAIERFLSDALLEGLTAADAAERLKAQPIVGPLDGRSPWWMTRLRRRCLTGRPDDDDIPEFDEPP